MCFEVAYDGLLRHVVDGGADVIVVPTNNATYTGTGQIEQQFAMSRLRAVETGRYVVVASTNGISGHRRPGRHVVGRAPRSAAGRAGAQRRAGDRLTPATVLGPWPRGALSAISVISLARGRGRVSSARSGRRRWPGREAPTRPRA